MPRVLSALDRTAFVRRLTDYAHEVKLKRCVVVLHGGEPLLAGAEVIAGFADDLRRAIGTQTEVDVGLQTNGILLTDSVLDQLETAGISVSLSLDGPRAANDLHRTSRHGRSSFNQVLAGLERLKRRPATFAGIIAVVDPRSSPEALFAFFDEHHPPKLDFLLPDAHHSRLPPGRDANSALYRDWLIAAFDLWLDRYSHLPVRTFEALLDAAAGLPSGTDAFGLGDVSLLSIETDGTYHDLDVLKIVGHGATRLEGSVRDTAISAVVASDAIAAHRRMLTRDGLSADCRACRLVDICGGGSLPHRFGPNGFDHPSIYCEELFALISHAQRRLSDDLRASSSPVTSRLPTDFDFTAFDLAETAGPAMAMLCGDAQLAQSTYLVEALDHVRRTVPAWAKVASALEALSPQKFARLAVEPGLVAWCAAYNAQVADRTVHDVGGSPLRADASYLGYIRENYADSQPGLSIGQDDPWLRMPFGNAIYFELPSVAEKAVSLTEQALAIVADWRPALAAEMRQSSYAVQFVRDPSAHSEKIVSFSDNSVPGALYVSVVQGDGLIDPYDLVDSLIHEHRHQKLYLLERFAPMVSSEAALVVSPWREDLRPPTGLLHAIFVFVELRRFWIYVRDRGPKRLHARAIHQIQDTDRHLFEAFATLEVCPLTEAGTALARVLNTARYDAYALT